MKKVGIRMSILMSISMSLCLSFTGMVSAGAFTVPGFIRSFLVSLVISFVLGLIIPVPKVNAAVLRKMNKQPGTLAARFIEAFVDNLIYSPVMSVVMITLAWFSARSHGANPPYVPMLLKGLAVSLVVGFLLCFIFQPLFMKIALKGVELPPGGPPPGKPGNDAR